MNIFKKAVEKVNSLNPLRFAPGEKVVLINDPKQEVYIVEELVRDKSGVPTISRGPMRQFPPSLAYRVRSEKWGGISDFRSDSLESKSQTAVERKIAQFKQEIKDRQKKIIDHQYEIEEQEREISLLERELSHWEKQPEHTV
jgi:hypothetical protein